MSRPTDFVRIWMPYCFVYMTPHVEKARAHTYLPVNRLYKPLGISCRDWVDYKLFGANFVRFTADPHKFERVWNDRDRQDQLYLYNDRGIDGYGEKLARILPYLDTDWRDIRGDRRTRFEMQRQGIPGA